MGSMGQVNQKKIYHHIKAVLFDFDGTLTRPGALDFGAIKQTMNCPPHMAILEYIETISSPGEKARVIEILDRAEMTAARLSIPNDGAQELLLWLRTRGVAIGIITRNALPPITRALENFGQLRLPDFDVVISREETVMPKPSPEGVYLALARLGVRKTETLLVGDYRFDIEAGNAAGLTTVLLQDPDNQRESSAWGQDHTLSSLDDLRELIEFHLPITGGKLPNRFLNRFLETLGDPDPSLLIPPGVGEDTAAVNIMDDEVLILKSDPITFVSEAAARYAVIVNANDVSTSGALPRWFLSTLLFPPGVTPAEITGVMEELRACCREQGVTLCGGHTEITDAVTRPVITGMIAGTVQKSSLIDKRNMLEGDRILMTKGVSVEGTSIMAREFERQLLDRGLSADDLAAGKTFLDQISITGEAAIASRHPSVSAMHDVTEGGVATALEELSQAGGHRFSIAMDRIPVFDLTRRMCHVFQLDPLGLIGSGSLLICCREAGCDRLIRDLAAADIQVTRIGKVLGPGCGILAEAAGHPVTWPVFDADEMTRIMG
ncbi:MAG: HAD-IA family hydrolase [bacterium]